MNERVESDDMFCTLISFFELFGFAYIVIIHRLHLVCFALLRDVIFYAVLVPGWLVWFGLFLFGKLVVFVAW